MKTYSELSEAQKDRALEKALMDILRGVSEGVIHFNDELNKDSLQERIDAAWKKAEAMKTPWFAHEYIMDTCRDDLTSMAQAQAEDSLYAEPSEYVVHGIVA